MRRNCIGASFWFCAFLYFSWIITSYTKSAQVWLHEKLRLFLSCVQAESRNHTTNERQVRIMDKNFKKTLLLFMLLILSVASYAQKYVTQFLSIPVDGNKSEMIEKLKDKGFIISPDGKDMLEGQFNGLDSRIIIKTNNNKVWRISVAEVNGESEGDIKIRFNNLCQQFKNNDKYMADTANYTIPNDENILYKMTVENKRYQAVYYQLGDSVARTEEIQSLILSKYTKEQVSNQVLTDTIKQNLTTLYLENVKKRSVWFMIGEYPDGKYYIQMFYDNVYNEANGESL